MRKILLAIGVLVLGLCVQSTFAAIPLRINHQGFIDVGGTAYNGNGDFRFALVDPDSGNNVWTNDASSLGTNAMPTTPVDLPVINGIYNVRLGDTTVPNMTALTSSLFNDDNLELRVWFDDGANGIEVLTPDQPLTSAPYAFHSAVADDADTVDGAHAAALEESAEILAASASHNADPSAHSNIQLDGSNVTTGTIDNARLNSGSGNGLDADTVDGFEASAFLQTGHNTDTGAHANIQLDGSNIATGTISNARLNMGSGNGFDADTVDGFEASEIMDSAGRVLQVVNFQTGEVDSNSGTIPFDDSVPQITEGYEYMTLAITPTSATSNLRIDIVWIGSIDDVGTAGQIAVALFQDSTANALAVALGRPSENAYVQTISFTHVMTAGTTSPTVFRVRAGNEDGYVHTFNGASTARLFGGALASSITITEISG